MQAFNFSTSSVDEAYEKLNDTFAQSGGRANFEKPAGSPFEFRLMALASRELVVSDVTFGAAAACVNEPQDSFNAGILTKGWMNVSAQLRSHQHGVGKAFCFPTEVSYSAKWQQPRGVFMQVSQTALSRAIVDLNPYGVGVVEFPGLPPSSPYATAHWEALTRHIAGALHASRKDDDVSLLDRALSDLAATAALSLFPHLCHARDAMGTPKTYSAPATLRRAVSFIDSNMSQALSISDIAQAARVSNRALQASFRRHLGITPTGYLRTARLAQVHAELRSGDPSDGTSVAAIARKWGFHSGGQFAKLYREEYGVLPSQTLRA